jgi:hypothetical protein
MTTTLRRGEDGNQSPAQPIFGSSSRRISAAALEERLPVGLRAAALEAGDQLSLRVEEEDFGLVVGAERAGERALRVVDLGPRPALLGQEALRLVGRVCDVDAEEPDLRMGLDEPGVGDRLALAGRSPGRPDVDEDRLPSEVLERDRLALERRAHNGARAGRTRCRRCRLALCRLGLAAAADDREQEREEDRDAHARSVAAGGLRES